MVHREDVTPNTKVSKFAQIVTPSFILEVVIALLVLGATYGTMQLSVSQLRADVVINADQIKNFSNVYMRMDVYDAKHKALEERIDTMSKSVEDIKRYLMGKPKI